MNPIDSSKIYLSPPHMGEIEMSYVQDAFATNWIAPLGPNVDAFEQEVAEYVGVEGALALNSGTSAIHLALRLLNVGAGDVVFCSSLTFVASANPIVYLGAEPVFIDSEPSSWNMSPQALQRAFIDAERQGKLPKAVIVVNLYGQSADYEPIRDICDTYQVPIIEDAAESLGATYRGKPSGTLGDFGIFSFNGNKIITTSGGGMLVSNHVSALEKARFWSTQARDQASHYEHSELGYNYRMSNVLAGIGRGQFDVLKERVAKRRQVFDRYVEALQGIEGIQFMPEASFGTATRWLTALTIDPSKHTVSPHEMVNHLAQQRIESRPVWKPLHLQPLFAPCKYYPHEQDRSISDELFACGICLPSGSNLSELEQNRVIDAVLSALQLVSVQG